MSKKVLTKKIVEQFIADEDSVDLSKFTKMDNGGYTAVLEHLLPRIQFPYDVDDGISVDEKLLAELRSMLIENLPDAFIVKHRHYHCEMEIEGYEIMNPEQFKKLQDALKSEESVCLPNAPGHWESELPISDLANAFQVISVSQDDVEAFRKLYQKESIGITDLSEYVLESISDKQGSTLTKQIIEDELAEDVEVADFSFYDSVDDDAVGALIGFEGTLNLGGLVELSDAMHDAIPQFKCSILGLASLSTLSDEDAYSLSKFEGEEIGLQGLYEISDSAAKALSQYKGQLDLEGIYKLSDESASHFAKHKGALFLTGLDELSDVAANFLKEKFTPNRVVLSDALNAKLNSLRSITLDVARMLMEDEEFAHNYDQFEFTQIEDDAAELLSSFEVDELFLDGVAELSDAAAESLSKYNGDLSLTGLKSLGDNAATSFSKFKGGYLDLNRHPDWQPAPCQPSHRLTKLSEAAAKSLAKIDPNKLSLTDELEEQVAKYR